MNKIEDSKELALKELHYLSNVLVEATLVQNLISESTMETISMPIAKFGWEEKRQYAKELVTILETSKTEKEVIRKAQAIQIK